MYLGPRPTSEARKRLHRCACVGQKPRAPIINKNNVFKIKN